MYHLNLIKAETAGGQRESKWRKYIPYLALPYLAAVVVVVGTGTYFISREIRELEKRIEYSQTRIGKALEFLVDNLPDGMKMADGGELTPERKEIIRRRVREILGESPENLQGTGERYHMELHIIQPKN